MIQTSTILWSLITIALVSMIVSRVCLHKMRQALERLSNTDNEALKIVELQCFFRHWRHTRRASHFIVASFFLLFIYSVIGSRNGYAIPLNGVYAVDMTLALLYWQALCRVGHAIDSAGEDGVFLDYMLHRISCAEDFVCSALVFNVAVGASIGLSLVDWSSVKDKLIRSE
jgi:hypothetical protein